MLQSSAEEIIALQVRHRADHKTVAFCGTRGIPGGYGGFETAVDEISRRFVEQGYDCVVFCRESAGAKRRKNHLGRRLVYVKGSPRRSLDTFVSSIQTGWHLLQNRRRYDYVFWFNNANLPGILMTRLAGLPTSVNTDGLEWRRAKWRWPFKAYYFLSSFVISCVCPVLIADSESIRCYYKKVFLKDSEVIPYGVPPHEEASAEKQSSILERYGVETGHYLLQITRFEPDNLPLEIAHGFQSSGLAEEGLKLLLLGYQQPTPYATKVLEASGEAGIVVSGAVYDSEVLTALRENCFCYVHGNTVGGTNPALLEAMATCPRILAIDVSFNREVLGDTGHFFTTEDIESALRKVPDYPDRSSELRSRVRSLYDWDRVAQSYENLVEGGPAAYRFKVGAK